MLRLTLHSGDLAHRNSANQLAALDIAYDKQEPLANYLVALCLRGSGEVAPDVLVRYPRWSASLWDLIARALTLLLYREEQAPPHRPDRRCAYATRLCASIERTGTHLGGLELASMELRQAGRQRGHYAATFHEDILGERSAGFAYGYKVLNPVDLLLRAICWAYFGSDVLGPKPSLILPVTVPIDGEDRFDVQALKEPARTGFKRFMAGRMETGELSRATDYVRFLMHG